MKPAFRSSLLRTIFIGFGVLVGACDLTPKNDYRDNSPTSGQLKVYYDEGLEPHVRNHAYTYESQYPDAHLELICRNDDAAIQALLKDSSELIVVSRTLNDQESRAFAARQFHPAQTPVAKSGVALIASVQSTLFTVTRGTLISIADDGTSDEINRQLSLHFDRSNSSVVHYFTDSILKGKRPGPRCSAANGTRDCIAYVSSHPDAIGVIDFAWLSDRDDYFFKEWKDKIRFIGIIHGTDTIYPSQSSFKTGEYPFTRTVYMVRKTGDFTLAKGFETFVAGPKGQLTFLKQGLLPARQEERNVQVKFEPIGPVE